MVVDRKHVFAVVAMVAGALGLLSARQDRTPAGLLAAAREALGGEAALKAVTSFTITGSITHEMDGRRTDLQVEIDCVLPDKYLATERQTLSMGPMGSGDITYIHGFNANDPIADTIAFGPMPPPPSSPTPSAGVYKQAFALLTLPMFAASFPGAPLTFTPAVGDAALDVTGLGPTWHWFFDPATHLPSRLTWTDKPIVSFSSTSMVAVSSRGGQVVSSGAPPPVFPANPTAGLADVTWELVASDYKLENGLNWPRKTTRSFDGKRWETLRIDKIKINPAIDVKKFRAKTSAAQALKSGEVLVRLETPLGIIDLAIDTAHAPVTAANFLKYVDGGFYNGGNFHRATRPDNYTPAPPNRPMMEIIQGGINPARTKDGFPAIPLERTSVTGLKHVVGTVSMARGTADTATSDFFILLDDQPSLDFGGKRFDDGQGAAAFGRVVSGLDVVRKIQQQPVTNQNLTPPVPILSASRVK